MLEYDIRIQKLQTSWNICYATTAQSCEIIQKNKKTRNSSFPLVFLSYNPRDIFHNVLFFTCIMYLLKLDFHDVLGLGRICQVNLEHSLSNKKLFFSFSISLSHLRWVSEILVHAEAIQGPSLTVLPNVVIRELTSRSKQGTT